MLYKSFDFVSALAYLMMFGVAGVSLTLAPLYYSAKYVAVGPAMLIESIVILMIGWSNVIGTQYLIPINRVKDFTTSVTLGAVVNIVLNFPLIHFLGLNGAMWSTFFSEIAVTAYQLFVVRKALNVKIMVKNTWKYLVSGMIMFIPVYWINVHMGRSWVWLFIEILIGAVIYTAMVFLLRAPVVDQLRELLKKISFRKLNKTR